MKVVLMDWEAEIDILNEQQVILVRQLAAMRSVCRQLKPKGFVYACKEDFLLQHGEWFTVRPWNYVGWEGPPRACYGYSLYLAKLKKLSYVEGVAIPPGFPLVTDHAWNADRAGSVIDGVWCNEGTAYLGVRFPIQMANKAIHAETTVLNDYKSRYKLFRKPWNPADALKA
jgi:hypothetical protein